MPAEEQSAAAIKAIVELTGIPEKAEREKIEPPPLAEPHSTILKYLKSQLKLPGSIENVEKFIRTCVRAKTFVEFKERNDCITVLYYEEDKFSTLAEHYLLSSTCGGLHSRYIVDKASQYDNQGRNVGQIIDFLCITKKNESLQHLLTFRHMYLMLECPAQTMKQISKSFGEPMLFWKDLLALNPGDTAAVQDK